MLVAGKLSIETFLCALGCGLLDTLPCKYANLFGKPMICLYMILAKQILFKISI